MKNIIENLIITIGVMITTAFITYKATIEASLSTNQATNKALVPALIKGIEKHSSNTENNTSNNLDIGKIKNKKNDSLVIKFNNTQKPSLEQKNAITNDAIKPIEYYEGLQIGDLTLLKTIKLTRKQNRYLKKQLQVIKN